MRDDVKFGLPSLSECKDFCSLASFIDGGCNFSLASDVVSTSVSARCNNVAFFTVLF